MIMIFNQWYSMITQYMDHYWLILDYNHDCRLNFCKGGEGGECVEAERCHYSRMSLVMSLVTLATVVFTYILFFFPSISGVSNSLPILGCKLEIIFELKSSFYSLSVLITIFELRVTGFMWYLPVCRHNDAAYFSAVNEDVRVQYLVWSGRSLRSVELHWDRWKVDSITIKD